MENSLQRLDKQDVFYYSVQQMECTRGKLCIQDHIVEVAQEDTWASVHAQRSGLGNEY